MQTVLLVHSDNKMSSLVRDALQAKGFDVRTAQDAVAGLTAAASFLPDLILAEARLPQTDCVEFCRRLRSDEQIAPVPLIMVAPDAMDEERVRCLEAGADDYLASPFSLQELVARVGAVLRRSGAAGRAALERRIGLLRINLGAHSVTYREDPVDVTPTEYRILELMTRQVGVVVSREQIMKATRNSEHPALARSVDVHIRCLRKKLRDGSGLIVTVRGAGYRLGSPRDASAQYAPPD